MTKVTESTSRHDIELNFDALTAYVVGALEGIMEWNWKHGDIHSPDERAVVDQLRAGVPLLEIENVKSVVEKSLYSHQINNADPIHKRFCNLAHAEWKKFKAEHMTYCDANDHSKEYELDAPILDDK